MARGSRSGASRADRRIQRQRVASALEHGLPAPTQLVKPMFAEPTSSAHPHSTPGVRGESPTTSSTTRHVPLAVKLLGLGFALLGLVYGLTLLRDRRAQPEPPADVPASPSRALK